MRATSDNVYILDWLTPFARRFDLILLAHVRFVINSFKFVVLAISFHAVVSVLELGPLRDDEVSLRIVDMMTLGIWLVLWGIYTYKKSVHWKDIRNHHNGKGVCESMRESHWEVNDDGGVLEQYMHWEGEYEDLERVWMKTPMGCA